jgi:hypothetical protein
VSDVFLLLLLLEVEESPETRVLIVRRAMTGSCEIPHASIAAIGEHAWSASGMLSAALEVEEPEVVEEVEVEEEEEATSSSFSSSKAERMAALSCAS